MCRLVTKLHNQEKTKGLAISLSQVRVKPKCYSFTSTDPSHSNHVSEELTVPPPVLANLNETQPPIMLVISSKLFLL